MFSIEYDIIDSSCGGNNDGKKTFFSGNNKFVMAHGAVYLLAIRSIRSFNNRDGRLETYVRTAVHCSVCSFVVFTQILLFE